jgi:hypothetical protein
MDAYEQRRRVALIEANVTQGDLVKAWGVSKPFVTRLVTGVSRSLKYERLFAKKVGKPYDELWPRPRDNNGREIPDPTQ